MTDDENGAIQFSAEYQKRVGTNTVVEIEARAFNASNDPFIESFESDDYMVICWRRYF